LGFALRATTQHVGNAGGLQILCCQGFEVKNYDFTLDAWNLKPSDVCNVGVTLEVEAVIEVKDITEIILEVIQGTEDT
jgi:hypothetical protein